MSRLGASVERSVRLFLREDSMSNLFIPPDGAMQFELARLKSGVVYDPPRVFWVHPAHIVSWKRKKCDCVTGYSLVMEALTDTQKMKAAERIKQEGNVIFTVCTCMGRIIE